MSTLIKGKLKELFLKELDNASNFLDDEEMLKEVISKAKVIVSKEGLEGESMSLEIMHRLLMDSKSGKYKNADRFMQLNIVAVFLYIINPNYIISQLDDILVIRSIFETYSTEFNSYIKESVDW